MRKAWLYTVLLRWRFYVCTGILVCAVAGMQCIFLPPCASGAGKIHVVTVDPAHGGSDQGVKVSEKKYEKDITLAIALLLQKELSKSGNIQIHLTRDTDVLVSTEERKKIATTLQSELFVSIHVNAGFGVNSTGYEVYFPGFVSKVTEKADSKEILKDMAKNKMLNDSVKFAQLVQKNLEGVFPRKSRGVRAAPVMVLEGLTMPAVVVEVGFATNAEDRKKLTDEKIHGAIAKALAQSIHSFF